jgi:hypothetical protein
MYKLRNYKLQRDNLEKNNVHVVEITWQTAASIVSAVRLRGTSAAARRFPGPNA